MIKKINRLARIYTPRVNFTNILWAAFKLADPKSAKNESQLKQLFVLLGSARIKAARKHVDEIGPCPGLHKHVFLRVNPYWNHQARLHLANQYFFFRFKNYFLYILNKIFLVNGFWSLLMLCLTDVIWCWSLLLSLLIYWWRLKWIGITVLDIQIEIFGLRKNFC